MSIQILHQKIESSLPTNEIDNTTEKSEMVEDLDGFEENGTLDDMLP